MKDLRKEAFRRRAKPRIFTALDLEMNQPSGRIIQIGAVSGDVLTGEIFSDRFNVLVRCDEPLCVNTNWMTNECNISALTGITDEMLEHEGVSLYDAFIALVEYQTRIESSSTFITWGSNDIFDLKRQLERDYPDKCQWTMSRPFPFGRRILDVKTLYQAWAVAMGVSIQAGLARALSKHKLAFKGRAHNALWDAYNTFRLAHVLICKLQAGQYTSPPPDVE